MNTTPKPVPRHLMPQSCYVCGRDPHGATFTDTGKGHDYWSNADAAAYFAAEDARVGPGRTWADGVFAEEKPWPEVG